MKSFNNILEIEPSYNFNKSNIKKEDLLFFDIETTGLSATTSVLYLIGCSYYNEDNNNWILTQWFATDYDDEKLIIENFFKLLSTKKYLIHYNGNGFDIPYIMKKVSQYHLDYNFNNITSIDLFKYSKKYKTALNLNNCKLTTIEELLGIHREDIFSGKQLINTYKEYIKIYSLERLKSDYTKSDVLLKDLLLHNNEDIVNLLNITCLLALDNIIKGNITPVKYHEHNTSLELICSTNAFNKESFNINITLEYSSHRIIITNDKATIILPIIEDTLKYFIKDYKNYFYLSNEDIAIHKSVGQYVDKEYRQQAKASTCYTKKASKFVPIINNDYIEFLYSKNIPVFKYDYKDKLQYIECKSLDIFL